MFWNVFKTILIAISVGVVVYYICGYGFRLRVRSNLDVSNRSWSGSVRDFAGLRVLRLLVQKASDPMRKRKRLKEIESSLPDLLSLITNGLRASLSLRQCIEDAAVSLNGSLSDELQIVVAELKVGVGLEDSLARLSERVPLSAIRYMTMVLTTHQRSGGNLILALESLSKVLQRRILLKQETRVLTAQSRFSAAVLSVLPVGFLILQPALTGRGLIDVLSKPVGWVVIGTGLVLDTVGFFIMRRLTSIDTG